jgi:hypothetical protein
MDELLKGGSRKVCLVMCMCGHWNEGLYLPDKEELAQAQGWPADDKGLVLCLLSRQLGGISLCSWALSPWHLWTTAVS